MKTIDYISPSQTVLTIMTENVIMTGSITEGSMTPNIDPLEREEGSLNF